MQISDSELSVTLEIAYLILVSLDNGAKMSPKRRTLLSLVFACIGENSLRQFQLVKLNRMLQADNKPKLHSNCFANSSLRVSGLKARIVQHIQNTMTVIGTDCAERQNWNVTFGVKDYEQSCCI